jgi:hypothetical protein
MWARIGPMLSSPPAGAVGPEMGAEPVSSVPFSASAARCARPANRPRSLHEHPDGLNGRDRLVSHSTQKVGWLPSVSQLTRGSGRVEPGLLGSPGGRCPRQRRARGPACYDCLVSIVTLGS